MFITGPEIIKTVTGEDVTFEELGGAMTHATKVRRRDLVAADEDEMNEHVRRLLSFIPQNNLDDPPLVPTDDDPRSGIPELDALDSRRAEQALRHPRRDPCRSSTTVTSSRLQPLLRAEHRHRLRRGSAAAASGSSRTSPMGLAGVLDIDASRKAARFVRFCDAFNIPLRDVRRRPRLLAGTRRKSTAASSSTAPSCSTRSPKRRSRRSR